MGKVRETLREFKENTYDKLDETILKQYTKLTKKWEEKGRSRYGLSAMFGFPGAVFGIFSVNNPLYPIFLGLNNSLDIVGLMSGNHDGTEENGERRIIQDSSAYYANKFLNKARLPLFGLGVYLVGKSGFELYDYLANSSNVNLENIRENTLNGLSFLLSSSSIYIRNSNPKILEKAPMWKKAYESLKEKILSPKPLTEPAPVIVNRSLEGRL
ncbi:MAG: hypothetical protein AABY15_08050 [Nanoarchaeota archaeon]